MSCMLFAMGWLVQIYVGIFCKFLVKFLFKTLIDMVIITLCLVVYYYK